MKLLLVAALAVMLSTAAQACMPSADDFKSLAASPSHLTPDGFSALTPAEQEWVCNSRTAIKRLDMQKGLMIDSTIKITNTYRAKYLTSAERKRIVDAGNNWFNKTMKSKGF